jgi:hypothetical protein
MGAPCDAAPGKEPAPEQGSSGSALRLPSGYRSHYGLQPEAAGQSGSGGPEINLPAGYLSHYGLDSAAPVQMQQESSGASPEQIRQAAALGTGGAGGSLPHLETIQRSFGRHDVSGIRAHVDPAATRGAHAMGAEAFTTGDHVAFSRPPSLHTAAHEAAHVIQQAGGVHLSGGVGSQGDRYEQHADAVADRVVAGESSEPLLDAYAASGAAPRRPDGATVQRLILPFGLPPKGEKGTDGEQKIASLLEKIQGIQQGALSNIESGHKLVDLANDKCLDGLDDNETLYVLGHGSGSTIHRMSPKKLIKVLVDLGLKETYRGTIVLASCHAGETQTKGKLKDTTYAAKFQELLAGEGIYVRIQAPKGLAEISPVEDGGPNQLRAYKGGQQGAELSDNVKLLRHKYARNHQQRLAKLEEVQRQANSRIEGIKKARALLEKDMEDLNEGNALFEQMFVEKKKLLPDCETIAGQGGLNWSKVKTLSEDQQLSEEQRRELKTKLAREEELSKAMAERRRERQRINDSLAELKEEEDGIRNDEKEQEAEMVAAGNKEITTLEKLHEESLLPLEEGVLTLPALEKTEKMTKKEKQKTKTKKKHKK